MKVEVNVQNPLMVGFWWTNSRGADEWTSVKYERLLDFCYGCRKLGHITQAYREEVTMSEAKLGHPMLGHGWLTRDPNPTERANQEEGRRVVQPSLIRWTGGRGMTLWIRPEKGKRMENQARMVRNKMWQKIIWSRNPMRIPKWYFFHSCLEETE